MGEVLCQTEENEHVNAHVFYRTDTQLLRSPEKTEAIGEGFHHRNDIRVVCRTRERDNSLRCLRENLKKRISSI